MRALPARAQRSTVSSSDDGYVHEPSRFDDDGEPVDSDGERSVEGDAEDWVDDPIHPSAADREFDWRGWILVGIIAFAFVVAPLLVLFYPPDAEGYLFAMVIVPLAPAVILAAAAVWATTRP